MMCRCADVQICKLEDEKMKKNKSEIEIPTSEIASKSEIEIPTSEIASKSEIEIPTSEIKHLC